MGNEATNRITKIKIVRIIRNESNLKYKYGNRHFWCRGYYVSTVGGNKQGIVQHIRDQEKEDMVYDQISFKEYMIHLNQ